MEERRPLRFLGTIALLFRFARVRRHARSTRQQELLSRKSRNSGAAGGGDFRALTSVFGLMISVGIHWVFATAITSTMYEVATATLAKKGLLILSEESYNAIAEHGRKDGEAGHERTELESATARDAALDLPRENGRQAERIRQVSEQYRDHGIEGFVAFPSDEKFLQTNDRWTPAAYGVLALGIVTWIFMLVCQGEGLELDIQRRRHPVWEWLLSHPIRPAAVLVAEGFTPFVCNPLYQTAPAFWFFLLGNLNPAPGTRVAAIFIGFSMAAAASLLNKTIESAAMLRMGVRTRGAFLGVVSWLGYVLLFIPLLSIGGSELLSRTANFLQPALALIPTSVGAFLVGSWPGHQPSVGSALLGGMTVVALLTLLGLGVATFAGRNGLQASDTLTEPAPSRGFAQGFLGRRDPMFRKDLLWFARDRGAIVQAVLVPLTMAAVQAYNLRSIATGALHYWQVFCGLAIICGTYFLMVLGPRSLISEGNALWISLTWPRGLESLLKAKARLWEMTAHCITIPLFIIATVIFPPHIPTIALVAIGWLFFARSLAMRSVTMITPISESGDSQPLPAGSRYAATVGALIFAIGVMTQNWHFAAAGVVFSLLVAAAAWQNLRARLPHLFDPWSEKLPPPPTLLHAMIALAIMVECVGIVASVALMIGGKNSRDWALAFAYGIVGFVTWIVMENFLDGRGVKRLEIWEWETVGRDKRLSPMWALTLAIGSGVTLALLALGYLQVLHYFPGGSELLHQAKAAAPGPTSKIALLILTVGLAPLAEEYLFRGLLYRALDREWGGWRAILGSAAYFAIYHPPISWLPVFGLGCLNAYLFRKTGQLKWPVVTHAAYNAVVIGFQLLG